jgi:hypothetical protein
VDPPLADVVSFAERALLRGKRASAAPEAAIEPAPAGRGESGDAAVEPADLTRRAMFHRLGQLAGNRGASGVLRSVDDDLAVLVYDSSTAPEPLAGVRGSAQPGGSRQLSFQGPDLVIEVEVDGLGQEMTCQVVPPQPVSLEVRHPGGTIDLGVDDFGTFYVPELPGRTISLRCIPLTSDGDATVTSWITV